MFKIIFNIGQQLRSPSLREHYKFLKKSENWSLTALESYQLLKLNELLKIANESSFYKKKFEEFGVDIHQINSLKDLKKLPNLTKNELIQFNNEIHSNFKFNKKFKASTSGTSGQSLVFLREESADSFNRASIFRGYSWYNVKPWEMNGYFWGFNFSKIAVIKTKILDFIQNRFRLFSYEKNELKFFYKKLQKASYLHGYSSMIYKMAKFINSEKLQPLTNLKMVKGTSEKIFESYQKEVKDAFGLKMISEYGAAETGIIAFECPHGNMHLNMEGVIVEEENNEIIVTNLQMHSFPIIRYKLGDYIKIDKDNICSCGLAHPVLKEVTGRIGNVVYGIENEYPSLYFYYIFKNISKEYSLDLVYQVRQEKKGHLIVLIEQQLNENQIKTILNQFDKYFKDDILVDLKDSSKIIAKDKKLKSFTSTI